MKGVKRTEWLTELCGGLVVHWKQCGIPAEEQLTQILSLPKVDGLVEAAFEYHGLDRENPTHWKLLLLFMIFAQSPPKPGRPKGSKGKRKWTANELRTLGLRAQQIALQRLSEGDIRQSRLEIDR